MAEIKNTSMIDSRVLVKPDPRVMLRAQIGKRLQAVRERVGISQVEAARLVGLSKQLWNAVELGRSMITIGTLVEFASHHPIDLNWLLLGRVSSNDVVSEALALPGPAIPKLDRAGLVAFAEIGALAVRKAPTITPYSRCSSRSVAVSVFDQSLAPEIAQGDVVVVDPEVPPESGDVVAVALLKSNYVYLRRIEILDRDMSSFRLNAASKNYPARAVEPEDRPLIIGTMIEHVRFGAR